MKEKYDLTDPKFVDEFLNDLKKKKEIRRKQVLRYVEEENVRTLRKIYKEYGDKERRVIKRVFDDAVTKFYDSYDPSLYERYGQTNQKNGGLYNILDEKRILDLTRQKQEYLVNNSNNDSLNDLDDSISEYREYMNENYMHKGRQRDTGRIAELFDLVFMKGWHGGADRIDSSKAEIWGSLNSNTPHYRTAGLITDPESGRQIYHRWGAWGREAKQTEAPFSIFCEEMQKAEDGELFSELSNIAMKKHPDHIKRIQKRIDTLKDTLYR